MDGTDRRTDEQTAERPSAPPPPPPRPPLRRRTDDRIVAGVASGLAVHLNVDPAVVRIGFVVLLFAGGIGLPLYIAAWLLIPEADQHETAAHALVRSKGPGFWIGIGILVLVALAVSESLAFGQNGWWPLVLIAAGIALWRVGQNPGAPEPPRSAPDGTPVATAHMSTQETAMPTSPTDTLPATRREPVDFTPPPLPSRNPSLLARVTVALALIAAGVTVLLDGAGVVEAHLGHVLASSLVVIGLGLVLGAWFGRARSLLVPGLLLAPLVVVASLFQATAVPWEAGFGERTIEVDTVAELEPQYRLAAGELTVRLDRLPRDAGEVEVRVEVGAGQINVRVPSDATVRLRARTNAGELQLFDRTVNGVGDLDETIVREGDPGAPTIVLDLRAGVGQIVVHPGDASIAPEDQES